VGGIAWGIVAWLKAFSYGEIETRAIPNEGIHRSARNAVVVALRFGLIGWLVIAWILALPIGLIKLVTGGDVEVSPSLSEVPLIGFHVGLIGSVMGLMLGGGSACLKHVMLRLVLIRNGSTPWNYVRFLDYAAERILLRKVGGGYAFIHRMLLEHFAVRNERIETTESHQTDLFRDRPEMGEA
jgi:hypothetical protein